MTHTAVTYYVGVVPRSLAGAASPGTRALLLYESRICDAGWFAQETRRVVLTRGGDFSFTPSAAQWRAGARWFRCDAVLHLTDTSLAPIPANFLAVARTAVGMALYRACLLYSGAVVACSGSHYYQAVSFTWLTRGVTQFPGTAAVMKTTLAFCEKAQPVGAGWYYVYPTALGWAHGNMSGVCYLQTA